MRRGPTREGNRLVNAAPDHSQRARWRVLIDRHLLGAITNEESCELEVSLAVSPEARADFRQRCNVDAALRMAAAQSSIGAGAPAPHRRKPALFAMAACLAVLMGASAISFAMKPAAVSVQVVHAEEARLTNRAGVMMVGEKLPLRELGLVSGFLRVRLESGVTLDLVAPVQAEFVSDMHVKLTRGQVTADVGEHGKGFVIETPQTRAVDLGTRFSMSVSESSSTDVAVFEGRVDLTTLTKTPVASLSAGDAVRVTPQAAERLPLLQISGDERDWRIGSGKGFGVITDVRDNVVTPGFHRYYTITHAGMEEGAHAYSNRLNPCWHALAGETMPSWLRGADIVGTFSVDRKKRSFAITLTLGRPASVFVLCDVRQPAPEWLTGSFQDTGTRLMLGPWNVGKTASALKTNGEPAFILCAVWRRDISHPGEVMLGPPAEFGQRAQSAMYGIAAKALP